MAERSKKISELEALTNASGDDLLIIVDQPGTANATTNKITVSNLFANVNTNTTFKQVVSVGSNLSINTSSIKIGNSSANVSINATGFFINNVATTGPQGAIGAQGATGSTGPQGVAGSTGPQGATGSTGPQGVAGSTGPQGAIGAQGATGSTGPQGAIGAQGATGSTGPQGVAGSTGPQGDIGVQGATGSTGPQGDIGAQGTAGLTGPQGATGAQGAQGSTGTAGTAGAPGADSIIYTFDSSTVDSNPSNGFARLNNTDRSLVTQAYVSKISNSGANSVPWLTSLVASTNSPNKSIVTFGRTNDFAYNYARYYVTGLTDAVGYVKLTLTYIDHIGTLNTNGANLLIGASRIGDAGTTGPQGPQGFQGNQGATITIPGPYADDTAAAANGVSIGSPYYQVSGAVYVRLT